MTVDDRTTETPGLRDVYAGARLGPYVRKIWDRRGYIAFESVSELRRRQMTSVLGNLWHLLNPILQILVFYLVFGLFLAVDRGTDSYILFITVGVFVFSDIQRATTTGATSIARNRGLIQAISFPKALLPVTSTVTESLASLPSMLVIYAVALMVGEPVTVAWLAIPVIFLAQFWMNLGLALIAARATTHFADVQQILPFLFRILLYGSGVIFSVDAYAESSAAAWVFRLNPVYAYISLGRWAVQGGEFHSYWFWSALGWTVALLVGGVLWFRAAEETYGAT